MKYFLYFLANIAISIAIFYTTYSNKSDYVESVSTSECFEQEAKTVFCAQCIYRTKQTNLNPQKGFLVHSSDAYTLLKQKDSSKARTCSQYLHIINYAKSDKGMKVPFQLIESYKSQFEGKIQINMIGTQTIGSQYESFVIYRLFPLNQPRKTSVTFADLSQTTVFLHKLTYLINGIIGLLTLIYLVRRQIFAHVSTKIIILTVIHFGILQAYVYQLFPSDLALKSARILILCVILILLEINNKVILLAILAGYACTFSSWSYLIYLNLMFALIFTKGMNQLKYKNIWGYIILNLTIYVLNQFFWYFLLREIADTPCRFIELMFLILTPTGLLLIKDEKQVKFKEYKANKRQTISLSGFEEQQDQEQNM